MFKTSISLKILPVLSVLVLSAVPADLLNVNLADNTGNHNPAAEALPDTNEEQYELALELSADTMYVGEVRQICVTGDTEYYLPDSLYIHISTADGAVIGPVFTDGQFFAERAGEATFYIEAKLDPEKVDLSPDDDGIRLVTKTVRVIDNNELADEQKETLEVLKHMEEAIHALTFSRRRAVVKGYLNADAPRLTREQIDRFIEESDSPETLYRNIMDAQPYPDYYGGSGFTSVLYCLNDNGTERIRVMLDCGQPPHQIIYERLDQNGIAEESCYLYPESQVNEVISTDPNPVLKDWFYSTMNDIPRGILEGDVTNDGKVNVADAIYLQKWLLCEQDTQEINGETADMNQDGKLNAIDLTLIKRTLL